ncbi:hypothetical protein, conserved [Plasmodium gonderi]|uniref:CSC1/OSCA1-like 7TM region domain-containing protein n=1 Tax=Plasmodium gonderi TaxID=77519 RepID=A0A1Y1JMQ3_PLAGO|nr:hypothetical protein, conserved [Plasmodium gonderi]GAW83866.1 hypothetical protein, conserved [Plasmodium gonderi]
MKNETEDFLIAFLFDIVFFAICVCTWMYLRKNRDENKISDNIYILNNQNRGEGKADKSAANVKEEDVGRRRKGNRFRTFLNIKDDKIVNTEIKYYLFFLKANRNIIFSLCILGTFLVLPLYLSLPRNDINNPSFFHYISAGSISDINIMTILFFITIIYSAISYTFIYLLWKKIRPSKKKTKKFLPQNFTIMVSRIDKNEINAYKIYQYFCNLTNNKVVSAYLILDYSIVYHEQKKIFNATKNLKLLKENEEKKNIKRDWSKRFLLSFLNKRKGQKNEKNGNGNDEKGEINGKNGNGSDGVRMKNNSSQVSPLQLCDANGMDLNDRPNKDSEKILEGEKKNDFSISNLKTKQNGLSPEFLSHCGNENVNKMKNSKQNENKKIDHSNQGREEHENINSVHDMNDSNFMRNDTSGEYDNKRHYESNENEKKKINCLLDNIGSDEIEISKYNIEGEAYYGKTGDTIGLGITTSRSDNDECKLRHRKSGMSEKEEEKNDVKCENYREGGAGGVGGNLVDDEPGIFLKDDTTDDEYDGVAGGGGVDDGAADDAVQRRKIRKNKNKISIKNYGYKLDIENDNLMSNNNEMLFYDLENLSTKENDNLDKNYKKKKKSRFKSESKRNIFHKLFFFLKKNKKSHWKKKLKEHLIKFYSIKNETPKKSTGVCFVSFIDTKSVHDCIHNIPFTERNKWIISNAPPNYDIIWKNLKNHSYKVCARFIILNALLLLANTIIILTVTSIDNILKLKIKKYREEDPSSGNISAILITWLSPFIVILVNSIIQPFLIACVSIAIGFIRKSSEHTYVLQGNFIFLILNTIIIPLLSLSPLSSLIKVMYSDEIGQWSTRLGTYLFNSSGFFAMRYLLHCCFLTCANQLLQIPQFSIRSIVKTVTKKETSAWTFDFGYWYGFNTTILALILTFSVAVPFILPLGSLYFFLRYYIDKYNLIYEVCRTNLDSHGAIIRTAIKFMLFSVAFFQLVMFTFFSRVQNKFISVGRNILFLSSSLTTLLLLCRSTEWVSTNHIKKKKGKRTFCYLCEKNVYVSNLKDLNKLKYAYANPYETKR